MSFLDDIAEMDRLMKKVEQDNKQEKRMFEKKDEVKAELRDVRILKFGPSAHGITVTAEGASIPNEVPVYTDGNRSVGRAIVRVKEDGLYADVILSLGTVEGMEATAIIRPTQTDTHEGTQVVRSYEVRAVGLNPIPKAATEANESPSNEEAPAQE